MEEEILQKIENLKMDKIREYKFVSDWYWNSTGCGQIVDLYRGMVNKKYDSKIAKEELKLERLRLERMQKKLDLNFFI